jgi:hypothetical protein
MRISNEKEPMKYLPSTVPAIQDNRTLHQVNVDKSRATVSRIIRWQTILPLRRFDSGESSVTRFRLQTINVATLNSRVKSSLKKSELAIAQVEVEYVKWVVTSSVIELMSASDDGSSAVPTIEAISEHPSLTSLDDVDSS